MIEAVPGPDRGRSLPADLSGRSLAKPDLSAVASAEADGATSDWVRAGASRPGVGVPQVWPSHRQIDPATNRVQPLPLHLWSRAPPQLLVMPAPKLDPSPSRSAQDERIGKRTSRQHKENPLPGIPDSLPKVLAFAPTPGAITHDTFKGGNYGEPEQGP